MHPDKCACQMQSTQLSPHVGTCLSKPAASLAWHKCLELDKGSSMRKFSAYSRPDAASVSKTKRSVPRKNHQLTRKV
jgi:hypothetical protein